MGKAEGQSIHSGLRLKHSLGQHVLVSRVALERILEAAELTPRDWVLEVGAGTGVLTRALAERAERVVSIEIDTSLQPALQNALAGFKNVQLVFGDALEMNLSELISPAAFGWKCVSNLPYYITSPLMFKLLETTPAFTRAVLLVQKEVAQRVVARPGSKRYGVLSIAVQLRSEPRMAGIVPAGAFRPVPEVDSAVLVLEPRYLTPADEVKAEKVTELARIIFSQRRKTLINALDMATGGKEQARRLLASCGIDPKRRPETLSLDELRLLTERLEDSPG